MSGRGYGDPERVAETGDLAEQAITTSRVTDYGGPRLIRCTKIGMTGPHYGSIIGRSGRRES
jgi:hypothetical protein